MPPSRRQFLGRVAMATAATGVGTALFADRSIGSTTALEGDESYGVTETLTIESFDGTAIEASLYEPDVEEPRPAILMTHGWGGTRADREPLAELYASNGYVVLIYDSRGFGDSGGVVGVDGPNEVDDAQELISWLAERENVRTDETGDPRIGMDGYSYGAGIQLQTAIEDDRIDALVPRWGWHDLRFSNDPNRVLKWAWFYGLYASGIETGQPRELFLSLSRDAIDEREAPEELREFWQERSPVGRLGVIDTPTLLISGWEDRLFTPNEAFANYRGLDDAGTDTRLLMYDYGHDYIDEGGPTDTQTAFADRAALAWMDDHLMDEAKADIAPVTFYRSQLGEFEEYDTLPEGTDGVSLAAGADGDASRLTAGETESITFEFDVADAFDLVGIPQLRLQAAPSGSEPPHLFAALSDVGPAGEETIIKDQVAATRVEREGLLAFDLIGIERHIPADHTLRLTLAVNDDDLVEDAVPFDDGLYVDTDAGGLTVKHSATHPSLLAVPTLDGVIEASGDPIEPGKG